MRLLVTTFALLMILPLAAPALGAGSQEDAALQGTIPRPDSLAPIVSEAIDLGAASDALPVHLVIGLDLHDKAGLDAFLAQVSDPASSEFQRFLTQDQFNDRYGPTDAQEVRVIRWLREAGFTTGDRTSNRLIVVADGDNAAVQRAFHVTIHNVLYRGQLKHAALDAPRFPYDIAKFTTGVTGLDDLAQMRPLHSGSTPVLVPKANVGASCCAFGPNDLAVLYGNSKTYTGTGQTEIIAGAFQWKDTDNTAYNAQWGLPALPAGSAQVCAGSGTGCAFDASNSIEVTLDVQMVHAVAPNAVIKNYMSQTTALTDFTTMYNKVVTDNPGHSVSSSWGLCETSSSLSYQTGNDNIFANGNAIGQSWFAASGDSGAKDCGTAALVVDHPANALHMMGTGGTHANCNPAMTARAPNCAAYGSETSWTSGGGGVSNNFAKPAWQTGCNVPADGKRDVPDIALESDTSPGNYVFYNGAWASVGGTSDAAPMMGGIFALLNQKLGGSGVGLPGTRFYQLCGGNSFHDVTSGNNGGYSAGVGYDMNTGVGTPLVDNLLNNWGGACVGVVPDAPTGLAATGGTGQVSLSWTDGANGGCAITAHQIYRGTTSGGETLLTASGAGTTYVDSAVTAGTTYYYKVAATNSIGTGAQSNEASATPTAPACPGPANNCFASATAVSTSPYSATPSTVGATTETGEPTTCGSITLGATVWYAWTAPGSGTATISTVSGSTTYDTVLGAYTGSAVNALTALACNDDFSGTQSQTTFTCVAGTTYRLQLGGYNAATGTAGFSISGCGAATAPGAPTGLGASAGNAQVTLTWTAPASNGGSAITNYKVYRGTSAGGETFLVQVGNVLTTVDTGLTNGQTYYYKVSAVNAIGEGGLSNEASATPQSAPGPVVNQNFDGGTSLPTGWTGTGIWRVASTCFGGNSPANSLQYDQAPTCNFNTGARTTGDATTPAFDISTRTAPSLTFKTKYTVESYAAGAYDVMQVQAKTATGAWTTLWQKDSRNPAQTTWLTVTLDLTAYKSTGSQIRFHFDSVDATNNAFAGWGVDDVVVT